MENKKEKFNDLLNSAIAKKEFLLIVVSIKGKNEYIINEPHNIKSKLDYYNNAYDENLKLKTCIDIKIVYTYTGNKSNLLKFLNDKLLENIN